LRENEITIRMHGCIGKVPILFGGRSMFAWMQAAPSRMRSGADQAWTNVGVALRKTSNLLIGTTIRLSYFDQVLAVEHDSINRRRERISTIKNTLGPKRQPIAPLVPAQPGPGSSETVRQASPLFPEPRKTPQAIGNPVHPNVDRMRPRPIPCDAIGLALSGGGIRSAAFSLGSLQALESHRLVERVDYLSTVSGGGYIGASLIAGMSVTRGEFPFGGGSEVRDNDSIGHIRNFSNYLMPRARSGLRNKLDVAAILLRGLFANAILVLTFLLAAALLTWLAYPEAADLSKGSFVLRLGRLFIPAFVRDWLDAIAEWIGLKPEVDTILAAAAQPFALTYLLIASAVVALILWALWRSTSEGDGNDADSRLLTLGRWLIGLTILAAILDLQPLLIEGIGKLYR
jgi:hypothetical protein